MDYVKFVSCGQLVCAHINFYPDRLYKRLSQYQSSKEKIISIYVQNKYILFKY